MWCVLLLALFVTVQGRAVNISNTWVLPEEGFPVFYRYFRDRISWYEADAVCQFHHANLVTVDTTAQYDAVRAYLKELDISSAVWVGLIRSNPDGDFTWTDYRGLSGDGYWSAAPDTRSAPLCAAADPAADYRWEARACGGPSVASFICELPVPQWALGNEGCMVRALPALTVLYLPESAAVQLTADCGLAGVKRVQCTGNVKREELLKELACAVDDQITPSLNVTSPVTSWQITTDSVFNNQDFINEATSTEENITTEHEDDINQSSSVKVISTSFSIIPDTSDKVSLKPSAIDKIKIPTPKNIDIIIDNILQENETPKLVHDDDLFTNEQNEIQENEKTLHHTKLHDELSRLGNLDTIFSQPTDHFVPPLVMAKAKVSDDMTALSIQEKLAQQLSEQQSKHDIQQEFTGTDNNLNNDFYRTESIYTTSTTSLPLINLVTSTKGIGNENIENDYVLPKKHKNKHIDTKQKIFKNIGRKYVNTNEPLETTSVLSKLKDQNNDFTSTTRSMTEQTYIDSTKSQMVEAASLELTVIIKEPNDNISYEGKVSSTNNPLLINISINQNNVEINETEITKTPVQIFQSTTQDYNLKERESTDMQMFINENIHSNISSNSLVYKNSSLNNDVNGTKNLISEKSPSELYLIKNNKTTPISIQSVAATVNSTIENDTTFEPVTFQVIPDITTNNTAMPEVDFNGNDSESKMYNTSEIVEPSNIAIKEGLDSIDDSEFDLERNITDSGIDFQSPLLSAASEPIPKPNRSRRIQQQPRNKFNPFRILG